MGMRGSGRRSDRGVGSNQYQSRAQSHQTSVSSTVNGSGLLGQVDGDGMVRGRKCCGVLWKIKCEVWVYPPHYSHGDHPGEEAKCIMAVNEHASPAMLKQLALDSDSNVRTRVAENSKTPTAILTRLAVDAERWVRAGVARHEAAAPRVLEQLARDPEWTVRRMVAGNSMSPIRTLADLASDQEGWVRFKVAGNPSAPIEALARLVIDANSQVADMALRNPILPEHLRALGSIARQA